MNGTAEGAIPSKRFTQLDGRREGSGFDTQAVWGVNALGLLGMQERAESIGGILEVRSFRGRGTKVIAVLPLTILTIAGIGGVWIGLFALSWRRREALARDCVRPRELAP